MDLPGSVEIMLNGAHEEAQELEADLAAYVAREPYSVVHDRNDDLTEHSLRLAFSEPFPTGRWSRKFATAIQNLRSALDYLVYAIAVHESRQDPPPGAKRLMFPILDPPRELPLWRIKTLSGPVIAAIQREQPDPDHVSDSPLWLLEQVNASSKHRTVHLTTFRPEESEIFLTGLIGGTRCQIVHRMGPVEDGAPWFTLTSERPQPNVEMGSDATAVISVERVRLEGEPREWVPVGNLLAELDTYVRGVVDRVGTAAGL
jgi:hypothetical protein